MNLVQISRSDRSFLLVMITAVPWRRREGYFPIAPVALNNAIGKEKRLVWEWEGR